MVREKFVVSADDLARAKNCVENPDYPESMLFRTDAEGNVANDPGTHIHGWLTSYSTAIPALSIPEVACLAQARFGETALETVVFNRLSYLYAMSEDEVADFIVLLKDYLNAQPSQEKVDLIVADVSRRYNNTPDHSLISLKFACIRLEGFLIDVPYHDYEMDDLMLSYQLPNDDQIEGMLTQGLADKKISQSYVDEVHTLMENRDESIKTWEQGHDNAKKVLQYLQDEGHVVVQL